MKVDRLVLDDIQPQVAALTARLRETRPANLEGSFEEVHPAVAIDGGPFDIDQAVATVDRLKRDVSAYSLTGDAKDKGKYTELLESTVFTFKAVIDSMVQELKRAQRQDQKLDSVKILINQTSFSEKVRFNDLKRSTNQSLVQLGRKLETVKASVVTAVNKTFDEVVDLRKAAQSLKADVLRQVKALNQSLDLGVQQMVEAGAKGTEQLDQHLQKVSGDVNQTQQALYRTSDQILSHFDSMKIAVVNGTLEAANQTRLHLENALSHQGQRFEAALQNQSILATDLNGNQTRNLIQSMVVDQLLQWHVGLADNISAEFDAHRDHLRLNLDQLRTFVQERMAVFVADVVGNRTRDLLDQSENRTQAWMHRVQANLTSLLNDRLQQQALVLDSLQVTSANQTDLLTDCLNQGLTKKRRYSVFEQFENIVQDQVPEDSESYHAQSMSELIYSEKGFIGILSVIVWCLRVLDARGGSRLAKLCRLRQHWITKVCFMP
jgi:hypothetical protein